MDKRQKAVDKARLARRGILDIKPYVPGKPIQEVKRELGLDDVIKLASNENPLGPSPLAVKAIRDAVDQIHIYPDGECHDLRKALSRVFGIGPECFIFGNGGEEIISLIGKAFINEGDACVIPHPVFDAYETVIRIMGGVCRYSGLLDYRIDLDDMLGRVDKKT